MTPDQSVLNPITPQALAAFKKHRLNIIQAVVTQSMKNMDEVAQHGDQAEEILTTGLDYTTQALQVSMQLGNVDMLEYQLQWSADRLPQDGVQPQHLVSRFDILAMVVASELTPVDAQEVNLYVKWLIERQKQLSGNS
jgi:hypothetical protein